MYDPRLASNIMGTDGEGIIEDQEKWESNQYDRHFFKTFHGKLEEGSIIHAAGRIRVIQRHISKHVNLDAAVEQGFLLNWYPVHNRKWLADLDASWSGLHQIKDFSFVQPMTLIQNYFGSRLAFIIAWNGTYCKLILALLPIALIFEVLETGIFGDFKGLVLFFGMILCIWSKLADNMWSREQKFFSCLWDLNTTPDYSVRPDFVGTKHKAPEDWNILTKQYPGYKYLLRQMGMWIVTILFCLLDFMCVYGWIGAFKGRMDIYASICLALIIQVFTLIYQPAVDFMTKHENHKYQMSFYNSYLMKLFIFQFVNQFCAFFFIAVKQDDTEYRCPPGPDSGHDCIHLLKHQLVTTITMLVGIRFAMLALSALKIPFFLWWEERNLRLALASKEEGADTSVEEIPVRGFIEEQAKYDENRIRVQIEGMMQLVITLGYLLIFGAVAPVIVPLCLLLFVVQLRANAWQLTRNTKRSLPRKAAGLGAWLNVVKFLMVTGVVFTGFLVVAHGPSFGGTRILTKVTGFIFYIGVMFIAGQVTAFCLPDSDKGSHLLEKRRQYVVDKVTEKNDIVTIANLKQDVRTTSFHHSLGKFDDEIQGGKWDSIPHLVDAYQPQPGAQPAQSGDFSVYR